MLFVIMKSICWLFFCLLCKSKYSTNFLEFGFLDIFDTIRKRMRVYIDHCLLQLQMYLFERNFVVVYRAIRKKLK